MYYPKPLCLFTSPVVVFASFWAWLAYFKKASYLQFCMVGLSAFSPFRDWTDGMGLWASDAHFFCNFGVVFLTGG
ncbi:hypothetical protein IEQ34_018765 [Dendrobium chrysotoxum]|uniref:Uncharacterized protein n=1 Tax=Dendrobium chrysotoxum TaxID=161865 RepID=A0AAV7G4Z5_DENCH|nr:hypothetical protein IEQ34_018765 [Dendrobium chrysotoxum]